tara:strand:+ start:1117 stop:1749 length:633 start_codon:yes stop_codon:yes gene_type:complete
MDKVKLTKNSKISARNRFLWQVELVVTIDANHLEGSLGGWVEGVSNITNPDTGDLDGIILDDAEIFDSAKLYGGAIMRDNAQAGDSVVLRDNADVGGNTRLHDTTIIEGGAVIKGNLLCVGASRVHNSVNLFGDLTLKNTELSETPYQIQGSKHTAMYYNGLLHVGCAVGSIENIIENISILGERAGYTPFEIQEYLGYCNRIKDKYAVQ